MPICIYVLVRPVHALWVRELGSPLSSGHGKQEAARANEMLLISDTHPHLHGSHPSPGHRLHQWMTTSLWYQHQCSPVWPPHPARVNFIKSLIVSATCLQEYLTYIHLRTSSHCNWNQTCALIMATRFACGPSYLHLLSLWLIPIQPQRPSSCFSIHGSCFVLCCL